MDSKFNFSSEALENRFEGWLSARPITPRPDFVARTLARIHAETSLLASAKAGDDAALDVLLDRWLGEQPLGAAEPEELVTHTRQTAAREEFEEARPRQTKHRKTIFFPAWARSFGGLAVAAATVVLVSYLALQPTATHMVPQQVHVAQGEATTSADLPGRYTWVYQADALLKLNDSLSGGEALLDSDNFDYLVNTEQEYGAIY